MRASSNLHRSLAKLTFGAHRQIQARQQASHYYELAEREQHFQHEFSGTLGKNPLERSFKIHFDILFVWDAGVRRDSQLGEPLFRYGFSFAKKTKGTLASAHVEEWIQDDDLNFIGAKVAIVLHNPLVASTAATGLKFNGTFHCSFQGFGMPIDGEGGGDSNADEGSDTEPDSTSPGATAPGGGPAQPPGGAPPGPVAPPGPLGPGVNWQVVSSLSSSSISDFLTPEGEGALTISGGLLTTPNQHEVETYGTDLPPGSHPTAPTNKGGVWYHGDKYAAIWTKPGKLAAGYKLRTHFVSGGTIQAIVLNMANGGWKNLHGSTATGLGIFFGDLGIGFITDLRKLGTVQQECGDYISGGQDANAKQLTAHRLYEYVTPAGTPKEYWVEVWRDGDQIKVGIWTGNPDITGAVRLFSRDVTRDPQFGPSTQGYFGFTFDFLTSSEGIKELTLYKAG